MHEAEKMCSLHHSLHDRRWGQVPKRTQLHSTWYHRWGQVTVPPGTPARDFWSVIAYSMKTKGFIKGVETAGMSSVDLDRMAKSADGSVEMYFSPTPPAGAASNWVPTGEGFFLIFRLYGPEEPLFEKAWTLGDVEKVR